MVMVQCKGAVAAVERRMSAAVDDTVVWEKMSLRSKILGIGVDSFLE